MKNLFLAFAASAFLACSLPASAQMLVSDPVQPDWTGATAGLSFGGSVLKLKDGGTTVPFAGPAVGASFGYNLQTPSRWVFGFEAGAELPFASGRNVENFDVCDYDTGVCGYDGIGTQSVRMGLSGFAHVRVGFAFGNLLPYVKAGGQFATATQDYRYTYDGIYPDDSSGRSSAAVGVSYGGGIEWAPAGLGSVRISLDYSRSSLGMSGFSGPGYSGNTKVASDKVMLGIKLPL